MSEDYNIAKEISSIINDLKQENISGDNEEEEFGEQFGENEEEDNNNNFDDNYEDNVEVNIEEEEDNPNSKPNKKIRKRIGKKQKLAESNAADYIKCSECSKYYTIRRIFIHRQESHQLPRFFCKFCKVDFFTNDDFKRHLEVVHPKRFECSVCHLEFLDREKFENHTEFKHRLFFPDGGKKFQCLQCFSMVEFTNEKEFHKHLEAEHFEEVSCRVCERRFPHPKVLSNHLRSGHPKSKLKKFTDHGIPIPRQRNYNGKCPVCELNCNFHPELLRHLREEHGMDIVEKETTFRTISDFNRWKFETEKRTKAYFCREKSYSSNGLSIEHYYCNRSGIHKPNPKKMGTGPRSNWGQTKKINATCPARIVMTLNQANEIKVRYVLEHVGHQCEVKYLPLSNFDQRKVEDMLRSGMTVVETYEACRNLKPSSSAGSVRDDTVERLNLIDKYSVRYIANKLRKTSKVAIAFCRTPKGGPNSAPKRKKTSAKNPTNVNIVDNEGNSSGTSSKTSPRKRKKTSAKNPANVNVVDNQGNSSGTLRKTSPRKRKKTSAKNPANVNVVDNQGNSSGTLRKTSPRKRKKQPAKKVANVNVVDNNNKVDSSSNVSTTETNTAISTLPSHPNHNSNNNNVFDIPNQIPGNKEVEICGEEDVGLKSDISTETAKPSPESTVLTVSSDDNLDNSRMDSNESKVVPLSSPKTTIVPTTSTSSFQIPSKSSIRFPASISSDISSAAAAAILEPHSFSAFEVPPSSSGGAACGDSNSNELTNDSMLDYFINHWNRCDFEQRSKISKTLQPIFDELSERSLTKKARTKTKTTTKRKPKTRSQF